MQPQKPQPPQRIQQPQKPVPPKSSYEKMGGIPRKDFAEFYEKGPYSIPYSRNRGSHQLEKMGKEAEKGFHDSRGSVISGAEIRERINMLKEGKRWIKTGAERTAIDEKISRLEEAKKRAGLK